MERTSRRCGNLREALVLVAVLLTGCGDAEQAPPTASLASSNPEPSSDNAPDDSKRDASKITVDPDHPQVIINTNLGTIKVELDRQRAPLTVHHFLDHAKSGKYRENLFHFVENGRMILGGGYLADGTPKDNAIAVRNEADNGLKNERGTIAMSRPFEYIDGATCHFFINLSDAPDLDHRGDSAKDFGYCVFGRVVSGLDIAEQISEAPTAERELAGDTIRSPDPPVVIKDVKVVSSS